LLRDRSCASNEFDLYQQESLLAYCEGLEISSNRLEYQLDNRLPLVFHLKFPH